MPHLCTILTHAILARSTAVLTHTAIEGGGVVTGCVSRRPVYGGVAALTGHSGDTARLTGVPAFCRGKGEEGGRKGRGGEER